jgi:glycosyltransferase involved in cell wall biosynthesis
MRFLIATGIYPPEIGGPAYYAKELAEALRKKGNTVQVRTFGVLKKLPTGLRHFAFFVTLIPVAFRAEKILALDTFSAALPAYFAARLFGKKLIVRTGGDFLWEQYVERSGDLIPLPRFYDHHKKFSVKEKIYFALTRFLVPRVTVVFSSHFQKTIWTHVYRASVDSPVVHNAMQEHVESIEPEKKNFLMYGRDIKLRNKKKLALAYQAAKKSLPDIVLETGQLPQHELIEKIRRSYAVILPSISEVTPNLILDALRCGKPFILTKYSEYAELYKDFGLFVDPLNVDDIAQKMITMCDQKTYRELVERIVNHLPSRTYDELAQEMTNIAHTV